MYYYPCKNCDKMEKCNPMMNMPMNMDNPMDNMQMNNQMDNSMDNPMNMPMNMPMMNMPMMMSMMNNMPMMMPMMNMPMNMNNAMDDDDLKSMYPRIYMIMYPMVKYHCDMMESKHGKRHCPNKEEMDYICNDICDKCDKHHRGDEIEDFDENEDNDTRQRRRYGRRRGYNDLAKILIIRNLIRRRRRF